MSIYRYLQFAMWAWVGWGCASDGAGLSPASDGRDASPPDAASDTESPDGSDAGSDSGSNPGHSAVKPGDVALTSPDSHGNILATITAYTWKDRSDWPDAEYELPIYRSMNREEDGYWNYLVDELLLSRVDVVMLHGRGCWDLADGYDGTGSLCPRRLSRFVDAVKRASAEDAIRVGMWDDTGAYPGAHKKVHNTAEATVDLSDEKNWELFWDHNMRIWFDTVPQDLWFRLDGKPVVAFWTLTDAFFSNQQGNASRLLSWLKGQFSARYGVEPSFIVQKNWFENDSTINTAHAVGKHSWFSPKSDDSTSVYTYTSYDGQVWGAAAPAFRGGPNAPGCGAACREVTRRDGATLNGALQDGVGATFTLLEGWTDMAESAGYYRSLEWRYPSQYINIVRRYADPEPETLRFQAEGADGYWDKSSGNQGNEYREGDLDIALLDDNSGWAVGWTEAGEWIEYQEVELGCGTYRFTARVSSAQAGNTIKLDLQGLPSATVPDTGGSDHYELVHLGEVSLPQGTYNLRVLFETGGVNLDWFFVKRAARCN